MLDSLAPVKPIADPFALVVKDLANTKSYAIDNILRTDYKKLEATSLYNLELKGKNFRAAILFLLAKTLYYNSSRVSVPFEESELYEKVTCLAASIEIAHNSSLL